MDIEGFSKRTKEGLVMRAVLEHAPGERFTARMIADSLREKHSVRISSGTVSKYLYKYDGKCVRKTGRVKVANGYLMTYEVIS